MPIDQITRSLIELASIPSTSGHEERVRAYLGQRLASLGLSWQVDVAGNLVASLPGEGKPLMLNAHMDRVPPGRGHQPLIPAMALPILARTTRLAPLDQITRDCLQVIQMWRELSGRPQGSPLP